MYLPILVIEGLPRLCLWFATNETHWMNTRAPFPRDSNYFFHLHLSYIFIRKMETSHPDRTFHNIKVLKFGGSRNLCSWETLFRRLWGSIFVKSLVGSSFLSCSRTFYYYYQFGPSKCKPAFFAVGFLLPGRLFFQILRLFSGEWNKQDLILGQGR